MRVLVTVECELFGNSERDRRYGLQDATKRDYLPYDVTSSGEGGCYTLRQIRIRSVRRATKERSGR